MKIMKSSSNATEPGIDPLLKIRRRPGNRGDHRIRPNQDHAPFASEHGAESSVPILRIAARSQSPHGDGKPGFLDTEVTRQFFPRRISHHDDRRFAATQKMMERNLRSTHGHLSIRERATGPNSPEPSSIGE